MTYFEEYRACEMSVKWRKAFLYHWEVPQIPYLEYTPSCSASLWCAVAFVAKHVGAPWRLWLSRSSGVSWSGSMTWKSLDQTVDRNGGMSLPVQLGANRRAFKERTPREGQVGLWLCWELVSSWELQRWAETLKLRVRFWLGEVRAICE